MDGTDIKKLLLSRWELFAPSVERLLEALPHPLGDASPPQAPGVYLLYDELAELSYVGVAIGSKGLRDRLISKHLSGDDSHAVQRAYRTRFQDRTLRRTFIKTHVRAKWIVMEDEKMILELERLLIWLFQPKWNFK